MKVFGSDGAPLLRYPGVDAEKALRYVWSKPIASAVIGTHSLAELEENIRIAREFTPMEGEELAAFVAGGNGVVGAQPYEVLEQLVTRAGAVPRDA